MANLCRRAANKRHKKAGLIFLLLLVFVAAVLPARGRRNEPPLVQATGRVRFVGGGPMRELVITGLEKEWHISREETHKILDLQHRTITVEGLETVTALYFANGSPAGERRDLRNIKIIAIEP